MLFLCMVEREKRKHLLLRENIRKERDEREREGEREREREREGERER